MNICGVFGEIGKLLRTITDMIVERGYILYEDVDLFNEKQMNCIAELGEILDRLQQY